MAERLASHVITGSRSDSGEFYKLCLTLARGIDHAVSHNEVPSTVQDLPFLLKQVCQRRYGLGAQACVMVLMASVKSACKMGWFTEKETEELSTLVNEMWRNFSNLGDINAGPIGSLPAVSMIMERFYPRMKMGEILASLEVKAGYGIYPVDFHISKAYSPREGIWLFVAQTDNVETSACIISPLKVNFLLNGKAVDRRTNASMDTGPQLPTNVTSMLKLGANLLQAVGQFNGDYVIVVAFMSMMSSSETPVLHDYVQPAIAAVDSDPDIVEGPSRISLHCPISYTRIRTPVKGHSCKHFQCFDFSNYLEINSRRPSWRCPHCNQYVCYLDICLDQNMVKVLKEVGENVDEVIISADGSWKAIIASEDHVDQEREENLNCKKENIERQESTNTSSSLPNILDLTEDNDEMEAVSNSETEDRKPLLDNLTSATNLTFPPELNATSGAFHNVAGQVEDGFWSGGHISFGATNSNARSNAHRVGICEPIPANITQSPVLTDAVSPALNQEAEGRGNIDFITPMVQTQSALHNFQLQQSQYISPVVSNEYGRQPSIPRHVSRTPIAVQALPAQSLAPNPRQRPQSSLNSLVPDGPSISSQAALSVAPTADACNNISNNVDMRQHFRAHVNPLQVSDIHPSSLLHSPATQNWDHQDRLFTPVPSRPQRPYRASSGYLTDFRNSHLQQVLNPRMPQPGRQSSSGVRPSMHLPQSQIQQDAAQVGISPVAVSSGNQYARWIVQQAASQVGRQAPSMPVMNQTARTGHALPVSAGGSREGRWEQRGNVGGMTQAIPSVNSSLDSTPEQNWQPRTRMRGSLSGPAYSALSQFMILPTQTTQTARPQPNLTPPNIPPQLQAFIASSRNGSSSQTPNMQTPNMQ